MTAGIAVTGGHGFLGWHLACRLRAVGGGEPARLGRAQFATMERLTKSLQNVDTIYHLAGVNRATSEEAVEQGNLEIARMLALAIEAGGRPVHVVYGNSIQSRCESAYGRGKAGAAVILANAVRKLGGTFADVLLPNLFGEHGRPAYNSFVATFCNEISEGRLPQVTEDRDVPLLHVQNAADALMAVADARADQRCEPDGEVRRVSEVLAILRSFQELYGAGEIPSLVDQFSVDLFNTYRSHLFPRPFPFSPTVHSDVRGNLFETVRSHGGTGQSFASTTAPGATRGNHFHIRKFERFVVLHGQAEISLRKLYADSIVRFRLSGEQPGFVDMPTLWTHKISNVGDSDLITMFWADQLFDPNDPDQYPEPVEMPTS